MGKDTDKNDAILSELAAIKRLLILLLIKAGTLQSEIAIALNVDRSTISKMFPAKNIEKFNKN